MRAAAALLLAASGAIAQPTVPEDGPALLDARPLALPVEGVRPQALRDTFADGRVGGPHEALDILAPRGTPVRAVDDGRLVKLFHSVPGGITLYQFDPSGRLAYYYAHLDRYADGLREGMALKRGDVVGYVGSTGNASPDAPHLHFAVFRLGQEQRWWQGTAVNPYPALRRLP
ncbi:MAG: M23 family metallopeptidase [Comamonadaceae bacterium]|nr:MAG: M23 family metallopeptidase [Comamonadaceae bacterium]